MRYTGGGALVEVLKRQEVNAIFCSPGTEWVPVWEALAKLHAQGDKELAYFNCRHEMLAVSAAIGYSLRGGGLPAVLLHTSAGLLNGAMAIRGAYLGQIPMLVCAGESARFTEGEDPEGRGIAWVHAFSDIGGPSRIAAPFVKWSQAVTSRETLSGAVARACQIARRSPPGPVFLSIPKEYLQDELGEVMPQIPPSHAYLGPNPAEIDEIATLLVDSQHPILITERLGVQPQAVQKIVELAEALAIPVFEMAQASVNNFPKEHPLYAGFDVKQAMGEADLILVVAASTPWNPQRAGNPRPEARVLFIDNQSPYQQFPFWNYRADMIMAADPSLALEALVSQVKAKRRDAASYSDRMERWKARHDRLLASWDLQGRNSRQQKPIDPHGLCHAINEWLPPEAIVIWETTTHTAAIDRLIRRVRPGNRYSGNIRGLGSGMGVALGVKLASAGQPVLHLIGDGAFNYAPVLSALGFAQEYHLPVLTVLFDNGAYRAMQSGHLSIYPEGWASRTQTFYGVDIAPKPDYAQQMKVFDAYGEKVEDPDEIIPALGRAWAEIEKGRSALLDVILDPLDPR